MDRHSTKTFVGPPDLAIIKKSIQRTVSIIKDFEAKFPDECLLLSTPSAVLVLSGLRAQSPYSSPLLGDTRDHPRLHDFLRAQSLVLVDEQPSSQSSPTSLSLVNSDAVGVIPDRYPFLSECWLSPPELSTYAFHAWCGAMDMRIAAAIRDQQIPAVSLSDWWTPHDIRFGTCLGYPWSAITAFVQVEGGLRSRRTVKYMRVGRSSSEYAEVGFVAPTDQKAMDEAKAAVSLWKFVIDEVKAGKRLN